MENQNEEQAPPGGFTQAPMAQLWQPLYARCPNTFLEPHTTLQGPECAACLMFVPFVPAHFVPFCPLFGPAVHRTLTWSGTLQIRRIIYRQALRGRLLAELRGV